MPSLEHDEPRRWGLRRGAGGVRDLERERDRERDRDREGGERETGERERCRPRALPAAADELGAAAPAAPARDERERAGDGERALLDDAPLALAANGTAPGTSYRLEPAGGA